MAWFLATVKKSDGKTEQRIGQTSWSSINSFVTVGEELILCQQVQVTVENLSNPFVYIVMDGYKTPYYFINNENLVTTASRISNCLQIIKTDINYYPIA